MVILIFVCLVFLCMFKLFKGGMWHFFGGGERKARAEYARIAREMPDSADAKISEAEFIVKYIANGPRVWVWFIALVGTFIVGVPVMIFSAFTH